MTVVFSILAAVTLTGAVAAMGLRKLVHCALALTVAFAGLAGLYLTLDAEFAGLAQLLVYVGAIAILIVFAILLTHDRSDQGAAFAPRITFNGISGIALALAVFAIFAWAITHSSDGHSAYNLTTPKADMRQIGETLIQRYVLPLEIVGLMLTAALIGAVILAMKESQTSR